MTMSAKWEPVNRAFLLRIVQYKVYLHCDTLDYDVLSLLPKVNRLFLKFSFG